jgi:hypothetical protein
LGTVRVRSENVMAGKVESGGVVDTYVWKPSSCAGRRMVGDHGVERVHQRWLYLDAISIAVRHRIDFVCRFITPKMRVELAMSEPDIVQVGHRKRY